MAAVDRSSRREVRNPVLALPGARFALEGLAPSARAALRSVLLAIRADARARADKAWRTHKAPMAVYWKAVGVYAGHLANVLAPAHAAPSSLELYLQRRRADGRPPAIELAELAEAA